MDAVRALEDAGVAVERREREPTSGDLQWDAQLAVAVGDACALFVVEEKGRAPYPNELRQLEGRRQAIEVDGRPLLVVPFVSEPLGEALTDAGWSWADRHGNFDLRAPGLTVRQRRATSPPRPKRTALPQGSGSLAIIRSLIRLAPAEEKRGATALAAIAKVSQPRASQVLAQLHDLGLVERTQEGRWTPRRELLLDRFLADYRGPGGSVRYLYSLDPPTDVAVRCAGARQRPSPIVVSADVGPDLIVPWQRPTTIILYATHDIDADRYGLVGAQGPYDANVILRVPDDRSVFPMPDFLAAVGAVEVLLADPSQLIWDLQDLGGADRLEAAGMMREWLLARP